VLTGEPCCFNVRHDWNPDPGGYFSIRLVGFPDDQKNEGQDSESEERR
jgi:hypothetical protein